MNVDYRLLWFLPAVIVYFGIWILVALDIEDGDAILAGFWIAGHILTIIIICLIFGIKSYL